MSDEADELQAAQVGAERPLAPGLYLVATPIGNLEDITIRALRVLRSVDRIACEDTRQTQKLLNRYDIRKPTVSYHLHNEQERADELISALRAGGRIAVVSDAGTPGIADPGAALVQAAVKAGVAVFPVPGANAAINALVVSGMNTDNFAFRGFLPSKGGPRRTLLELLREQMQSKTATTGGATQVFYEAPHRIMDTLQDIAAVFGPEHRIVVARELTKVHEEFLRGTVSHVLQELEGRGGVRGEIVLLIDGRMTARPEETLLTIAEEVAAAVREGLTEKEALKRVAKSRGMGKSETFREWQRGRRQ